MPFIFSCFALHTAPPATQRPRRSLRPHRNQDAPCGLHGYPGRLLWVQCCVMCTCVSAHVCMCKLANIEKTRMFHTMNFWLFLKKVKIKDDWALNTFTAKPSCVCPSGPVDSGPSHTCPLWSCHNIQTTAVLENQGSPQTLSPGPSCISPTWLVTGHWSLILEARNSPLAFASPPALEVLIP